MDHQDWNKVVLHSPAAKKVVHHHVDPVAAHMAKLAISDTIIKPRLLSAEAVRTILEYRRAHSLTQKQLDAACAFPANTLNHLESRKVAPTTHQLQTLNRVLKAGLTLD